MCFLAKTHVSSSQDRNIFKPGQRCLLAARTHVPFLLLFFLFLFLVVRHYHTAAGRPFFSPKNVRRFVFGGKLFGRIFSGEHFLGGRRTGVRRTSDGRPMDVRRTSDGRPTDVRQTSNRRPTDVQRTSGGYRDEYRYYSYKYFDRPLPVRVDQAVRDICQGSRESSTMHSIRPNYSSDPTIQLRS